MTLSIRAIGLLFALELAALGFITGAMIDRRMHQRDPAFGLNQWGYRAEARGSKAPGEVRVAIVGGSSAFEGSRNYSMTFAGQLFFELRDAGAPRRQGWSVVNLAEPRVGADSYPQTLRDYAYLDPDAVVVFDGYDADGRTPPRARRQSLVFRAAGYLPLLPARVFGYPEWLSDADLGIAETLRDRPDDVVDLSCAAASAAYCSAMEATVRTALDQRRAVMVLSPPAVSRRHATQQQSLASALARTFGAEPRFAHLDLGSAIDLADRQASPDGIHRTEAGNHTLAQRVAPAVLQLVERRR